MCIPSVFAGISFREVLALSASIGVGLNVGVPIGNHGYMSIGAGRWL